MKVKLNKEEIRLLKVVVDHFINEDKAVRERQVRIWRQLKLAWEGFSRIWYSETAHDWRVWDNSQDEQSDQEYYDKKVNVFRAYLETIIAALSITVPGVNCYPDDADNTLDLMTAKAGDKIYQLVARHNNVTLLWLHALYIYCTEGMIACYNYPREDEKYGTYDEREYKEEDEVRNYSTCPMCNSEMGNDEFQPEETDICPSCGGIVNPIQGQEVLTVTKLVGITKQPKTRQCIEVYGGLYVKIPNYARKQEDCLYLDFSYETHFAEARGRYPNIREKIGASNSSSADYDRQARISPQYEGAYPENNVTVHNTWLRPNAFEVLQPEHCDQLKKKFPKGCKAVFVNDEFAEVENEVLDDCWTLSYNPLADFLHHDPLGLLLISLQELTEDIISLITQTIEHGIPQTMADPAVLDFKAYNQTEVNPGSIIPATPKAGRTIGESFYEVKTATLSAEVLPFFQQIQGLAQLVSGALPSLFGGALEDNKTASAYSMSRTQAQQRQNTVWKMLIIWWKEIFGKVIPQYIKTVKEDERDVQKDDNGNFVNTFIRLAELQGKIGKVELDASEVIPISQLQIRDTVLQLLNGNNPVLQQFVLSPENLPLLYEAIGLVDFVIPGQADRDAENEEIREMLNSAPIVQEASLETFAATGQEEEEVPSIEIDPILDNHQIRFETCRQWAVSEAGRLAKIENADGYKNVLLHARAHYMQMQQQMMMAQQSNASTGRKPKETDQEAPIMGDENVAVQ